MSNYTPTEKLLKLADYLETVEDEHFAMDIWYYRKDNKKIARTWDCGTSACALGHACFIPEFKKEGLRVAPSPSDYGDKAVFRVMFDGSYGSEAAAKFFGIGLRGAADLFGSNAAMNRTRKQEIAFIRKFAAKEV